MWDDLAFGGGSSHHSTSLKAQFERVAQGPFEASFLIREALIQPLRSPWEDDTCLGRQSEGISSKVSRELYIAQCFIWYSG